MEHLKPSQWSSSLRGVNAIPNTIKLAKSPKIKTERLERLDALVLIVMTFKFESQIIDMEDKARQALNHIPSKALFSPSSECHSITKTWTAINSTR